MDMSEVAQLDALDCHLWLIAMCARTILAAAFLLRVELDFSVPYLPLQGREDLAVQMRQLQY